MGSAKNRLVFGDLASPIITVEGDCIRSVTGILSSDILAQELALRDMDGEPLTRENYGELMERIDAYLSEFDEHGTDNISVDLP